MPANTQMMNQPQPLHNSHSSTPCPWAGGALWHLLALLFLVCLSCGETRRQMTDAAPSLEDLGKQVLAAMERNNFSALDALRLNEQEYRTYIWPSLPISKIKEWQKQYQYVWHDVDTKNNYGLRLLLEKYGGEKFDFVSMRFAKNAEKYDDCTIHKDARVIVKDSSGAEKELKLFGSVVESGGCFKIMSFNIH
jgi:hypothetical protein